MAVSSRALNVTDARVRVSSVSTDAERGQYGTIHNGGAVNIYLGGDDVTDANGLPVAAGAQYKYELQAGESLWAICAATQSAACRVLENGI